MRLDPLPSYSYRPPDRMLGKIEEEIGKLKEKGIIEPSGNPQSYQFQSLMDPIRIYVDHEKLNAQTKLVSFIVEEIVAHIESSEIIYPS